MQLPRLPSGVPRYALNTGLAVFLLSLALWLFSALHITSIDSLRGRLTEPLHLDSNRTLQWTPSKLDSTTDRRCHAVSSPPEIAVIVKTGANVLYDKLPTQLLTALRCANDPLIFSDLAQTLGPYQVHDVLDNVTAAVKNSPDFDYYHKLQEYHKFGQDIRELRDNGDAAWKLDRYKFIPMLQKTWKMRPNREWYVFLEGDTYIMWTNLMLWLQHFDPDKLYYFGEQTYVNNEGFAHGGSGFVISRGAMSKVLDNDPDITSRYDEIARNEFYGDYVLMKALKEKGVELGLYKPMLQGEPPSTLRFGPGRYMGERYWCQPLISLHHVTPGDVDAVWQYEQQRHDPSQPILFADMYKHFMKAHLPQDSDDLENWYNYADDALIRAPGEKTDKPIPPGELTPLQEQAYQSFEQCAAACAEHPRCMQYAYEFSEKKCSYSWSYRLGGRYSPTSDGKRYKSGWVKSRINADTEQYSCQSPLWRGFHTVLEA
jgi:PAN domain